MLEQLSPFQKDAVFLDHLPPLFQEIVLHARRSRLLCSQSVVAFDQAKQMLARKRELAQHAERTYFRPRGNTAG